MVTLDYTMKILFEAVYIPYYGSVLKVSGEIF